MPKNAGLNVVVIVIIPQYIIFAATIPTHYCHVVGIVDGNLGLILVLLLLSGLHLSLI